MKQENNKVIDNNKYYSIISVIKRAITYSQFEVVAQINEYVMCCINIIEMYVAESPQILLKIDCYMSQIELLIQRIIQIQKLKKFIFNFQNALNLPADVNIGTTAYIFVNY